MKKRKSRGPFKALRRFHRHLHSPKLSVRNRAQKKLALIICIPVMLGCLYYIASWEATRRSVVAKNTYYRELYESTAMPETVSPSPTACPTPPASAETRAPVVLMRETPTPTVEPTATPEPTPTSSPTPTPEPTDVIVVIETATAVPTVEPTIEATAAVSETPALMTKAEATATAEPAKTPVVTMIPAEDKLRVTIAPTATPFVEDEIAEDRPITPKPTPDAETIIYAIETPPPVQASFNRLLELNPEVVGYLTLDETISLPVVQRRYDNEYYLNHDLGGEESLAGTLFLDGLNLLVPEDANLIVYGHNMRNGTMFRELTNYADYEFLREHALLQFDTLYRNRKFVPFAVLTAGMDPEEEGYLDIRRFSFDAEEFDTYIQEIRNMSVYDIPVEVSEGDTVLLLVTCEYTHDNGRFIVAWRALRDGEDEVLMRESVKYSKPK